MIRFFHLIFLLIGLILVSFTGEKFRQSQQRFPRVRTAYEEKEEGIKKMLKQKNIDYENFEMFFRVFKEEKLIELWAKNKGSKQFTYIKPYNICQTSGKLGPKRKRGDDQIPEGFYHIEAFNPDSWFYLSLKVSYPNTSDRIIGSGNLGGDIFIHGNCVTIGCMPMTDEIIKELYVIAVEARDNGQSKIPVHIFPFKMNNENWSNKKEDYSDNPQLISFWENIRSGYTFFEKNKTIPDVTVANDGKYIIK